MLFLLKVAVTPVLVAAVSVAARWWGPTIGGILMGLPWFTGPTMFVLIQDKGIDFGVAACVGIQLAVVCISAYIVAYGIVAKFAGWPISMAGSFAAFASSAWAMQKLPPLPEAPQDLVGPLCIAALAGATALTIGYALLPRPCSDVAPHSLPWWDIPMRMAATGVLVTILLLSADALGPQLSGILSAYPVILTVVCTFTHYRWGREAVWRMLRAVTLSLFTFVVFFLVVGLALPASGLIVSYLIAVLVGVAMTSALVAINRVRVRHSLGAR
jgi:hypothetical protein